MKTEINYKLSVGKEFMSALDLIFCVFSRDFPINISLELNIGSKSFKRSNK
jgi:hypothetical protein